MTDGWQSLVQARARRYLTRALTMHPAFGAERQAVWGDVLVMAAQDCDDDLRHGRVPSEENDR